MHRAYILYILLYSHCPVWPSQHWRTEKMSRPVQPYCPCRTFASSRQTFKTIRIQHFPSGDNWKRWCQVSKLVCWCFCRRFCSSSLTTSGMRKGCGLVLQWFCAVFGSISSPTGHILKAESLQTLPAQLDLWGYKFHPKGFGITRQSCRNLHDV